MITYGFFEETELYGKAGAAYDFNEDRWLEDTFANYDDEKFHQRMVSEAELAPDFVNSNWYKYYLAVEWYKNEFFDQCSDQGLEIPV